ncbi:zinc-ribbon domain-containing protein [Chelatococcus sambhunathii]|uniref:Zinc-ribbon domain-containing protein n=1 Tax=Chelatococcus sambhunathii TaxID=363953 RepID=A0ABU1DDY5_9HYPH|nr:zinc-ribbon domain-containing protein [Chelatococcus sambhunathii]MDR4306309.1 zinc-ribbon domain-containing protein [Chelatococcus sambhunathii]
MTIICPFCEASYQIAPETLGAGRKVRCARCRTEWFAENVVEADAGLGLVSLEPDTLEPIHGLDDAVPIDAVEPGAPELAAPLRKASPIGLFSRLSLAPKRRRPSRLKEIRPVAIVAALGVVLIGLLIDQRVTVVRAAPSLAALFDFVGLPVNVRGLAIADLRSVERIEEGVPLLLASGVVTNVSGDVIETPRIRLAITGERDRELYAWTTVASRARLAPGESAPFRARLASPPAEGRALTVRFVAPADLARAGR